MLGENVNKLTCIIILMVNCIVCAYSQVLLKKSSNIKYKSFIYEYLNIRVIVSYSLFFAVLMVNSLLMRYLPLVILSPIAEAFPFILSIFAGFVFFNEKITREKIIGVLFISVGILFVAI